MVQQENRNLLQLLWVGASGTPAYGSVPMINRQTLSVDATLGSYNDRMTVFNQLKASPTPGTQPHDGCLPLYGRIMIGLFFVYLNYTTI